MKRIMETEEEEVEFLSAVAAAESFTKRRKPNQDEAEGAYTAALKGSKSRFWQHINPLNTWQSKSRVAASAAAGSDSEKTCPCGSGPCLILTANTERNRGRMFYKCPLPQENGGCGFFLWCDNDIASQTNNIPMPTKGSSGGSFQSCNDQNVSTDPIVSACKGYCNMNDRSNNAYTIRTGSSCFKCGKDGHWAKDCHVSSSDSPAEIGGKPAKSGTCYKCGKPGHWARDCTSKNAGNGSKSVSNLASY
ncbi:hypothetical protein E1A91_D06G145300v1 [Gossypium mustelinum]|uniref:CCHC-type domain-containing protein n=1 Tax=Gossypium mustelinum TaxID=34275 RepID=A0A5D2ULL4_GOSMU|nr:hypothetical protein E1A91_D06G145300v1 [Gossypium mustelinum]